MQYTNLDKPKKCFSIFSMRRILVVWCILVAAVFSVNYIYLSAYIHVDGKHKLVNAPNLIRVDGHGLLPARNKGAWNRVHGFLKENHTIYSKRNGEFLKVAIAGGLTSANTGTNWTKEVIIKKFPLFATFIPSFCKTCSVGYEYHFYFAYDSADPFFNNTKFLRMFEEAFAAALAPRCCGGPPPPPSRLHLMSCSHHKHPAWAQNDAIMEAYLDGMPFFYRINDDTLLVTPKWTETFIETLRKLDPPFVGVVGPQHIGGNTDILTYDFTSSTHQDIFGFHYPRVFTDWFADNWITKVYGISSRMKKLRGVSLEHSMKLGQRYVTRDYVFRSLDKIVHGDSRTLRRYIEHVRNAHNASRSDHQVIAYAVTSRNRNITMGVLRNVQLAAVIFPKWTVRIYTTECIMADKDTARILTKARVLGAHIYVRNDTRTFDVDDMRLHLSSDVTVHAALVRNPLHRLDDRQKVAVDEWLSKRKHDGDSTEPINNGAYGLTLNSTVTNILDVWHQNKDHIVSMEEFLRDTFKHLTLCYSSSEVCGHKSGKNISNKFVDVKNDTGVKYDEFMVAWNTVRNRT